MSLARATDHRALLRLSAHLAVILSAAAAVAQDHGTEPAGAPDRVAADSAGGGSEAKPPENQSVDFRTQVQPILVQHCGKCHGPKKRSGGLRLDERALAERGGDSGKPVLGGTPQTNELLARVTSDERSYRMPKNAPPLSEGEIDVLRRWVAEGTPWPEPRVEAERAPFWARLVLSLGNWGDRYGAEYEYALPFAIGLLALNVLLLAVIRCRTAYRAGRRWTRGRLAGVCRFCDGVKSREVLMLMALSLAGFALAAARGHVLKIDDELAEANDRRRQAESFWSGTAWGWPPKPVRPDGPKRVAATYYRGNCERNAELFNGGNYLTATFVVNLCDDERRQLDVGDMLPDDGVFVRVEIKRAPGTTEMLFSRELMDSVLLVQRFYGTSQTRLQETPARLETLEPDQRWVGYVPIGLPDETNSLTGIIYMYTGQVRDGHLSGTAHFGIQYDLHFADGKLAADSDLWMDSFGNSAFANPDPPGRLPYREWFSDRPMPSITGENSQDPELLGIDEYVEEGLLAPAQQKQEKQSHREAETAEPAAGRQSGGP